jgi:hypothetical protein
MAEFIHPERLHQLSAFAGQLMLSPEREQPVLRWTLDAATGRPVSHWELAIERSAWRPVAASPPGSTRQCSPDPSRQRP